MTDEQKWYFAKAGKAYGPFSQHELCTKFGESAFCCDDYVYCKEATGGWIKAASIPGLTETLELEPEPEPEHHQVPLVERAGFEKSAGEAHVKAKAERDKKFWSRLGKK